MNPKHKLMMLFAMIHLGLAALGAAAVPLGSPDNVPLVEWYRHFTGTDNSFRFFAPGVAPQERVIFELTDSAGASWTDTLRIGPNHEANMCFETVPVVLAAADDQTAWNMLHSMSETMLKRHPTAVRVNVRVETFAAVWATNESAKPAIDFPRMTEYQRGKRPEWLLVYEVQFPPEPDSIASDDKPESNQS
jgi:hypothetical protein